MGELKVKASIKVYERGSPDNRYTLDTDLNGEVSMKDLLEYSRRALIATAKTVLSEELARGFDKNYMTLIDNSRKKNLQEVSPLGKIQFIAQAQATNLITDLYKLILFRSPIDTGLYKDSHLVFVNGELVARNLHQLLGYMKTAPVLTAGTVIRFVNIMPYASKLERQGITAGNSPGKLRLGLSRSKKKRAAGVKIRQPNGAYFLALKEFRSSFGRNVKSFFEFYNGKALGIPGAVGAPTTGYRGNKLRYDFATPRSKKGGKERKPRPYTFPTIRLLLDGGTF